jgi:uncharacterized protein
MLWRILVWIVLIGVAWWAFRDRASSARRTVRDAGQRSDRRPAVAPPERMVDCVRCGLHLPASEALKDATGRPYCSEEHRVAGPRMQP